jgi:hypothetical protein
MPLIDRVQKDMVVSRAKSPCNDGRMCKQDVDPG